MGLNPQVRLVMLTAAYLIGGALALPILVLANGVLPGIWLPLLFGVAFVVIYLGNSGFTKLSYSPAFLATVILGVTLSWMQAALPYPLGRGLLISSFFERSLLFSFSLVLLWLVVAILHSEPSSRRPLRALIPLVCLFCIVAFVSSDAGGASPMYVFFHEMLGFSEATASTLVFATRKLVHFTFYGFVALLAMQAALKTPEPGGAAMRFALLSALALACFDELRQATATTRTGSIWDIVLDMSGAGVFVLWAQNRASHERRPS